MVRIPRLIIRVEKQTSLINEAFNSLEAKGIFRKTQMAVFKSVYKAKLNGLYALIKRQLRKWIVSEGENFFETQEEGDHQTILAEKNKFENFMEGGEKQLNKDKEYTRFKSDRIIIKIMKHLRITGEKVKDKAIKFALGEGSVVDFFNRCGISVTWNIQM